VIHVDRLELIGVFPLITLSGILEQIPVGMEEVLNVVFFPGLSSNITSCSGLSKRLCGMVQD
jgi:hypothetical protein